MTFLEKITEINKDIKAFSEKSIDIETHEMIDMISKYFPIYSFRLSRPISYHERYANYLKSDTSLAYIHFTNGVTIRIFCDNYYSSESGNYDFFRGTKYIDISADKPVECMAERFVDLYTYLMKSNMNDLNYDNGEIVVKIDSNYEFYSYEDNKYNFGYNSKTRKTYGKFVSISVKSEGCDDICIETRYDGLDRFATRLGGIYKQNEKHEDMLIKNLKAFLTKYDISPTYCVYPITVPTIDTKGMFKKLIKKLFK